MRSIYFHQSKESHQEMFVKWTSKLIAFKIVKQKKREFLTRRRCHGIKRKMQRCIMGLISLKTFLFE
jgi:hypothetical protein